MPETPRTLRDDGYRWLHTKMGDELRVPTEYEDHRADEIRHDWDEERARALVLRASQYRSRVLALAREARALHDEMRDAGINRDIYRQIGHARRSLDTTARMLAPDKPISPSPAPLYLR